jgi:putative membrane protein
MKKNEWFKKFLKSCSMGLGMIPGVSAGTMAVLVGIYDELIDAIASLRKNFKASFRTLLPILLGLVLSSALILVAVQYGYGYAPFVITCVFAGFILGSLPLVTKELKNEKTSAKGLSLILIGLIVAAGIGVLSYCSVRYWNFDLNSYFVAGAYWWVYIVVLVAGFISAIACVIPGISGAMILYIFGLYTPIISIVISQKDTAGNIVVSSMFQDHTRLASGFGYLFCLLIGILFGLAVVAKAMKKLLETKRVPTFQVVLGFILGSVISMFINQNIFNTETQKTIYETTPLWGYIVGPILFVLVLVGFYFISRKMGAKQEEAPSQTTETADEKNEIK